MKGDKVEPYKHSKPEKAGKKWKKRNNKVNKKKTVVNMVDINPTILIITL